MKKKITYASIVPLIGGENIGIHQTLDGQLPEYVLSYTPFGNHDKHYVDYIRGKGWNGDYVYIDENPDYKPATVDMVNTVCPCAGLSSLSPTSSADSAVNEWLYTTAEYVLGTVSPKIFWGENAPRLFTDGGKKVADKLFAIGQKYGYSLNLYATESRLHGLAQIRPRTFYFFTKSETSPIFRWFKKDQDAIENILKLTVDENDPMNIPINNRDPMEDGWVRYCMAKTGSETLMDLYNKIDKTEGLIGLSDGGLGDNLTEVAKWFDENDLPNYARVCRKNQDKLNQGKGYWAHGITMPKKSIGAFVAAMPGSIINPFTGKFLTIRDGLRIMGLPEDFNLSHENPRSVTNHICQNVPVTTAADMAAVAMDYLNGNAEMSNAPYIKQNNKSEKVQSIGGVVSSLEEFFN